MPDQTNILLLEDDESDVRLVEKLLLTESAGFDLETASTVSMGLELLTSRKHDLILLDPNLPDSQGEASISKIVQAAPNAPLLVVTENEDDVSTSQWAGQSSICKCKLDAYHLKRSIRCALERHALKKELDSKDAELKSSERRFQNLIIENPDAILIVDKNGYVRFANPAVETLFGRSAESMFARQFGFPITGQQKIEMDILRTDARKTIVEARVQEVEWEGENCSLAILP